MTENHDIQNITERTFDFATRIVKLCATIDNAPGVSRTLSRQLLRTGTSIGANVQESQAAESRADFAHKCNIALKEARETHYWLRLLVAADVIPENRLSPLTQECDEITRIIAKIIVNTRKNT